MPAPFSFRPLTSDDLPLLHDWLNRPHVAEWWDERRSWEQVREDFTATIASDEVFPYMALLNGTPIGYIQAYRVMTAAPDWWPDETDPHALGTDQFIAEPNLLGRGLGTRMLKDFVAMLFEDPKVTKIQTDPSPDNARAIAAYRKAGFQEVGVVDTPDGPALLMVLPRPEGR